MWLEHCKYGEECQERIQGKDWHEVIEGFMGNGKAFGSMLNVTGRHLRF